MATVLLASGCASSGGPKCEVYGEISTNSNTGTTTKVGAKCSGGGLMAESWWQQAGQALYALTGNSAYDLDFSQFKQTMTVTNGYLPNQTASAVIVLRNGSTQVATRTFNVKSQSGTITLTDPKAVQSWIAGYEGLYQDIDVQTSHKLVAGPGILTMQTSGLYGNQILGTASVSRVIADCPDCEMQ